MKHTKKLIAVLICIAMLPWAMIPAFADGQAEDNVLYSMTFDKSGDEAERVAEWNFDTACSINQITEDGYLQVQSSGWGTGIGLDTPFIASTFTAQLTYRWVNTGNGIAGSDQIQWRFGGYDDFQWQVEAHEGLSNYAEGSSCLRRWGNKVTGGANANAEVNPDIVTEWKNGEWVTATIEVLEGRPLTFTFESNGKSQTFNYCSGFSSNALGSLDGVMYFYFINQPVEIYDFNVVEGVDFAPQKGDEMYSMTFDKSGDEAAKIAEWDINKFSPAISNDDGYLKLGAYGNWDGMTHTAGKLYNVGTFTAQYTYRHNIAPANSNSATGFIFNGTEIAVWRDFVDNDATNGEVGSSRVQWWGNQGYNNQFGIISKAMVDAIVSMKWITITLEVENGVPKTLKFEAEGVDTLTMNYTGTAKNVTAATIGIRSRSSNIDLYDLRVVYGVDNDLTAKNDATVEMLGLQKHTNGTDVRFIAKLKDINVEDVKFEIKAVKSNASEMIVGKYYVSEAITVGYTGIVENLENGETNSVEAGDGELFVVFVIRGLDLAGYDYDFTVSAIAGSSQSMAHTYQVK